MPSPSGAGLEGEGITGSRRSVSEMAQPVRISAAAGVLLGAALAAAGARRSFLIAVHVPASAARGATQRTGILAVSTADPFQSARGTLTTTVREPRLRLLPATSRRTGVPGATAYHPIALENSGDSAER